MGIKMYPGFVLIRYGEANRSGMTAIEKMVYYYSSQEEGALHGLQGPHNEALGSVRRQRGEEKIMRQRLIGVLRGGMG